MPHFHISLSQKAFWVIIAFLSFGGMWSAFEVERSKPNSLQIPTKSKELTAVMPAHRTHVDLSPISDNQTLLRDALLHEETNPGVFRFAEPIEVDLSPTNAGKWNREGENGIWHLQLRSPGAQNLNLGLSQFHLPKGAELSIEAPSEGEHYSFTSEHQQKSDGLWTPIFSGEELNLTLRVAWKDRSKVMLQIRSVQHGFRSLEKFDSEGTPGGCQIDTICNAADLPVVGAAIDEHRDQVRSVAVYSLMGMDLCSGAMLNNTAQNGRPLFLTAYHCGITEENASSLVVYWNFDNLACRELTDGEGIEGTGERTHITYGARWLAGHEESDMNLLELNGPIEEDFNVYFAGWSRDANVPNGYVFGIHHPEGTEKRFSLAMTPIVVDGFDEEGDTHWRVEYWDYGSTAPGSSGSPLFDQNGLVIGQLTGGYSECGRQESDWYGRISKAWFGGGTPETSLNTWLAPDDGNPPLRLQGLSMKPNVMLSRAEINEGNGDTTTLTLEFHLNSSSESPVTFSWRTVAGTAQPGEDYIEVEGTHVTLAPGETLHTATLEIVGDEVPEQHEEFGIQIYNIDNGFGPVLPVTVRILNDDFITPVFTSDTNFEVTQDQLFEHRIETLNTPTDIRTTSDLPGIEIDNEGALSWLPAETGTFELEIIAENPAGSVDQTLTVNVLPNPLREALDGEGLPWRTGPNAWTRTTQETRDGEDAARSAPIGNVLTSWMETEVNGPDTLVFWWKVSSEEFYDELTVTVNGTYHNSISGEVDWETQTISLPAGNHRVRWEYSKDYSEREGTDRAYVDQVSLASRSSSPVLSVPPYSYLIAGEEPDLTIEATGSNNSYSASGLPGSLRIDRTTGKLSGNAGPGVYQVTFEVQNAAGIHEAAMTLYVLQALPPSIGPAIGSPDLTFYQHILPRWTVSSANRFQALPSLQSGDVSDNEESWVSTLVHGPGELRFWWRVSSEELFDELTFYIDDQPIDAISGEMGWSERVIPLKAGEQLLQWAYIRDDSEEVGQDAGWLASIQLSGYAAWAAEGNLPRSERGPDLDPDGDGRPNSLEYALGSDPQEVDSGPYLEWESDDTQRIVRFEKPQANVSLNYEVEYSPTLQPGTWSGNGLTILQNDTVLRVSIPDDLNESGTGFVRLRIDW